MYFRLSSHKEMFDPVPDQYNVATESSFLKTCMSHLIGKCDVLFINITLGKPRNTDFRFEIRCVDIL